ncbi:hypothetical protein [Paraburkholderia tropica]|uniref:Uncharacterized protein n=1 Tax=Paraburkholderia tropica TaxID=92647 RepID=A0A1A5X822_9BURK|nr:MULTISPECIES: hypothetical protein [Paraburkholderia]MBB2978113.1 hypothetical protein [Paraburkholderia tropica]MBB2998181.1 hypothetical protein [Paraburkholderia tropica]MBB6317204.1 hypothetical protein [Paraburkholderia tropica]OBR49577.1 hypothetical protein A6456_01000 [Paraburkholderia tropica]PXX20348.1 hypothetical protein C7400_10174 [Paraburkholderia tropica]
MTLWKTALSTALVAACALAASARAQETAPPAAASITVTNPAPTAASAAAAVAASGTSAPASPLAPQGVVNWTLEVDRDGQKIDSFEGSTTVGQARTDTHHKVVTHNVGCKDQPAGSIDLQRTITVSPLQANASAAILAIDAQETLENPVAPKTTDGCKLPPQPRQVSASHPGLNVPAGQWVTWTIVDHDPKLVYRVRANLAPPAAGP